MPPSIDEQLAEILTLEREVTNAQASIERDFPEAWERFKQIDAMREQIKSAKDAARDTLITSGDYDTHQIGGYNISVTRIVKLAVEDPSKVSQDYKKTEEVIDIKRAQEDLKVMKTLPAGFVDKSTYRLNWKEVKNA